jgi:hypothetical protein
MAKPSKKERKRLVRIVRAAERTDELASMPMTLQQEEVAASREASPN